MFATYFFNDFPRFPFFAELEDSATFKVMTSNEELLIWAGASENAIKIPHHVSTLLAK